MRASTLLGMLLAGLGHAFIIPPHLEDGVWAFELDHAGNAINGPVLAAKLSVRSAPAAARGGLLAARQGDPPPLPDPQVQCKSGFVNPSEFAAAKAAFSGLCDQAQGYPPNVGIVVAQGSALAFMCNFGASNRCWRQEYAEASLLVDGRCGSGRVGSVQVQRYNKSYGRANRGDNIC